MAASKNHPLYRAEVPNTTADNDRPVTDYLDAESIINAASGFTLGLTGQSYIRREGDNTIQVWRDDGQRNLFKMKCRGPVVKSTYREVKNLTRNNLRHAINHIHAGALQ